MYVQTTRQPQYLSGSLANRVNSRSIGALKKKRGNLGKENSKSLCGGGRCPASSSIRLFASAVRGLVSRDGGGLRIALLGVVGAVGKYKKNLRNYPGNASVKSVCDVDFGLILV